MQTSTNKNRKQERGFVMDHAADLDASLKNGEQYIRSIVSNTQKRIKKGQQQVQQVVAGVDKKLHENPWPIVAGVAASCVILGYIMGKRK